MKDFLKHVGATVVGLFLFSVVVAGIGIMAVVGMVASASSTRSVASNSVLVLTLDGPLAEQSEGTLRDQLTGDSPQGLREMLAAVRKAKANDDIKGIYIEAGDLDADMAQAEERRGALMDFRKSGKWIVAYGEEYSQLCYYLATTANKIYMNPQGLVDWHGLGGQVTFLRDAYAKIGIKMV
ncbi:signal peptide peptidase SppA, partial [Bacillus pumilus]